MKFPSLYYLKEKSVTALKRFPLSILFAFIGVISAIYLIENEHRLESVFPITNLLLTSALAIPLFFCITVYSEKFLLSTKFKTLGVFIGLVLLALIYYSLPSSPATFNTAIPYIRYAIYNVGIHLLVAFIPFVKSKELNGFWQYNKLLFIRFITSVLYSGFIYVGIVLALVALNVLFDIKIRDQLYFELWVIVVGLFNTWFFTAGMPSSFQHLDADDDYPKGLKIFSQYILFPLLILYLLILYGYGLKIISTWDWPKGVVSYLIVCVAVLGILTLLLVYPYSKQAENKWMAHFSRVYYFILIPLIVLLFFAISMRIGDYGITINRYIIYLLGIWLSIVAIYFAIGKTNIKFIPVSLFLAITLTSFGPWGMFSVSENSQVNRLKNILEQYQLLSNDKIIQEQELTIDSTYYYHTSFTPTKEQSIPDSVKNDIKSILDYLNDFHGLKQIKPWFAKNYDADIAEFNKSKRKWQRINEAEIYMNALGLEYTHHYIEHNKTFFSFSSNMQNHATTISGYDYQIQLSDNYHISDKHPIIFNIDSNEFQLTKQKEDNLFMLSKGSQSISAIDLTSLISELIANYGNTNSYNVPPKEMTVYATTLESKTMLVFKSINLEKKEGELKITYFSGDLYLSFNDLNTIKEKNK